MTLGTGGPKPAWISKSHYMLLEKVEEINTHRNKLKIK